MASSGEVPDLEVLKTDSEGDIELAMTLWTSQHGPVVYNDWQATYLDSPMLQALQRKLRDRSKIA